MSLFNKTILAFAAVYFIWGSTYLAIRFTIETLPPFLSGGLRFFLAGLILFVFSLIKDKTLAVTVQHWRSALIVGGFLLLGGNGSVVWAEKYVPSGLAALIVATTPFWMVLLNWLWKKGAKPSMGVMLGMAIGFLGVGILILPDLRVGSYSPHLGGILALLFASFSWSIGSVYARTAKLPGSPFLSTGMQMMAGGFLLILWGCVHGEFLMIHPAAFSIKSIMAFIYLLFIGSLVGFTAYIWLLKNVGVTKASTYAFVNPVIAVFLGCLLANEQLNAHLVLAASLIIVSVVIITLYHREVKI